MEMTAFHISNITMFRSSHPEVLLGKEIFKQNFRRTRKLICDLNKVAKQL